MTAQTVIIKRTRQERRAYLDGFLRAVELAERWGVEAARKHHELAVQASLDLYGERDRG